MTLEKVLNSIDQVWHPEINYSLLKLGIVKDIKLMRKTVSVTFVFPFAHIPIAEEMIRLVEDHIEQLGLDFEYDTRLMNDEERSLFLKLEAEARKE
jgi:ATP-binding protein involved in chromosome partitioning